MPAPLSVMIIKPCQQILNQRTQLHRRALRKPPWRPRSQVFIIHLENWGCHKSFWSTSMESPCQQQKGQFSPLSCSQQLSQHCRRGGRQGWAPPALPTLELLWHWHLSPCRVNGTVKKKQSEGKQCSFSHTNSQPLAWLLTPSGWEELAVCCGGWSMSWRGEEMEVLAGCSHRMRSKPKNF